MTSVYHVRDKARQYLSVYAMAEWLRQLRQEIEPKTLLALFVNYICLKGAMYIFIMNTMLAVYKKYGMEGAIYQLHYAVALSPWAMKGLVGTISDTILLRGYKKRWYQVIVSVLGFMAAMSLFLADILDLFETLMVPFLPLPFFLIHLQIATCDLLCEGRYAAIMRETNVGSKLVSFVWMAVQAGSLFATLTTGFLLDYIGSSICFLLMVILAALPLWPWLRNYLGEPKSASECVTFEYETWHLRKEWFMFAIMMTGLNALQVGVSMHASSSILMIYVIISTFICCTVQFLALPASLAKVNLFMFSCSALYINLQGAMDYWYTANPECVPAGPNFSFSYYQALGQSVGICAGFVGLWIFNSFLSDVKFRTIFFLATSFKCLASITDFIILMRWNLMVGVPDRFLYLLGDSIVYPIVSMTSHMPAVILTCKLCPRNVESTAYSLLCAFGNYGGVVSRLVGVYLLDVFDVHLRDKTTMEVTAQPIEEQTCTYANLPTLIIIGHCILPAITMILARVLIPDARLDDDLDPLTGQVITKRKSDVETGQWRENDRDSSPVSVEQGMIMIELEP